MRIVIVKAKRVLRKSKLRPSSLPEQAENSDHIPEAAPMNPALLHLPPQAVRGLPPVQRVAWAQGMHHMYGNQRLQRMLTADAAPAFALDASPKIRRYEAGEHAQFGAKPGEVEKTVKIKEVEMTYGEMIAMGDLFEDPDAINNATPDQLTRLRDLIRDEKKYYTKAGGHKATENEWDQATGGAYLKLAAKNTQHFKDENLKHWEKFHRKAMSEAQKKDGMNTALITNAFADHFLTDAFSAGHLIDKPAAMKQAETNLTDSDAFATAIATRVLASPAASELLRYEGKRYVAGWTYYPMDATTLMHLILLIKRWKNGAFFSNFAKLVHDRLNQDVDPKTPGNKGGIEVQNDRGDKWRMSGDDRLALSPKTLEITQLAVAQSRQNLENASSDKKYDFDKAVHYVLLYVPRPTADGQKQVDEALTSLLDPTQVGTLDAYAQVISNNMDALISNLLAEKLIRLRTATPAPATAPAAP
jgi:hypothetical protein